MRKNEARRSQEVKKRSEDTRRKTFGEEGSKRRRRKNQKRSGRRRRRSQEKKRKMLQEAPPNYWDWLPPELQMDIEKKALYALIQERLDKGFRDIHNEMAELPRCRLHGTVS